MLTGNIIKSAVLSDEKTGKTTLFGVAQYYDNMVNFKVAYDWDTLDYEWFTKELKDTLARDLDIATSKMDINADSLLSKMRAYSEWNKETKR